MTAIKDIKVTEEFLGLGQTITKCQIEESRADCETRKYREIALATCQCAPLSARSYYGEQVADRRENCVFCECLSICIL